MKNLTLLIFLIPIVLISQNLEPTQLRFYMPFKQDSVYLSSDSAYFQQTQFIKGNHWDNYARLGKVIGYNQMDVYSGINTVDLQESTYLFIKLLKNLNQWDTVYFTHCQGPEVFNARGIEYSPILTINPSLTHSVQTVSSSTRNAVFGFQTIRGTKNYTNDCLIVDSNITNGTVILEEPWTADQLSSKSVN